MNRDEVLAVARQLRAYAEHEDRGDWRYTRDLGALRAIRYDRPYDKPTARLRRAVRALFGPSKSTAWERDLFSDVSWWHRRLAAVWVQLRPDPHLPDGQLDNGRVLTVWEETGEYLEHVQPSVGVLIADLLEAHPELPEAQALAAEIARVTNRGEGRMPRL